MSRHLRHSSASSPTETNGQPHVDLSDSPSPPRNSEASEGYPSWLPKRPPPPGPASTIDSSYHRPQTSERFPLGPGSRKPAPRNMRVVSIQHDKKTRRESTDQTRVSHHFPGHRRVLSRATTAGLAPSFFSSDALMSQVPRPVFRAKGLHLEILRNPSLLSRLHFYLLPLFVFAHIPLQFFFDFNAVFILFQVVRYPNPDPGSGRNWVLGIAAYIACWVAWIVLVVIVYEIIYSFWRRWRIKRPLMIPLYFSSPAFSFVSMTSYVHFCFMRSLRNSAFFGDGENEPDASSRPVSRIRQGLAETCWFYAQNWPTVVLLLPRAGLCIALFLAFSKPDPSFVILVNSGVTARDTTYFSKSDGTLTRYARVVLVANAAWTAWRTLVLLFSLIGLWILSGLGFAGLCGPRFRWEEEENEKALAALSDTGSQDDALPWEWKSATRTRVQELYEFCLTAGTRPSWAWGKRKEVSEHTSAGLSLLPEVPSGTPTFEGGVEQIFAAIGLGSSPSPARRGVLTEKLFETPTPGTEEDGGGGGTGSGQAGPSSTTRGNELRVIELSSATPPATTSPVIVGKRRRSKASPIVAPAAGPSTVKGMYPFTARGAQISSQDKIPFPTKGNGSGSGSRNGRSSTGRGSVTEEAEVTGLDEEDGDGEPYLEHDVEDLFEESEDPSSRGGSNSMSSLGRPVGTRHSIQYPPPAQPRASVASSRVSRSRESNGNRESTEESQYPRSESSPVTPGTQSSIPMPPRRARSGPGVPPPTSSSTTVIFPQSGNGQWARTDMGEPAVYASTLGDEEIEDYGDDYVLDQPEPDGLHEAAEGEDVVGLLSSSSGPSPRGSFLNLQARRRHRSGSNSGSNSNSGSPSSSRSRSRAISFGRTGAGASSSRVRSASISNIVRSRTQSLIRAASRSSSDLAQGASMVLARRSRASSSMARLEEDTPYSSSDASGWMYRRRSVPSSAEANDTFGQPMFGHPLRMQIQRDEEAERRRLEEQVAQTVRRVCEGSLATPPFTSQSTLIGPATRSDAASTERRRTPEVDAPETIRGTGPAQTDVDVPLPPLPPSSTTATPPVPQGTTEESADP